MPSLRITSLLAALLLATACVHSNLIWLDPTPRPPTQPDSVQLLAKEPTRPYTVIALVSASSSWGQDRVRRRLQSQAAKAGGHALLFDSESLASDQGKVRLSAKVIVYNQPEP